MGLRFRRSLGFGPFRYTLSASSRGLTHGVSAGVRGARVSLNSRGQSRTTVSLPGTGVSYVKQGGAGSPLGRVVSTLLKTIAWGLVGLFLVGLLIAMGH